MRRFGLNDALAPYPYSGRPLVAASISFSRPVTGFSGAENAVVGNVGVALITVRLIGRAALVAHPLVPSTLAPRRPRPADASDSDEDRNTGNPVVAPLIWLVLGMMGRIVMGMVPGAPSW
jgi:hypothetical protein